MKIKKFQNIIILFILFLSCLFPVQSQWKEVTTVPAPYSFVMWLDVFFLNNNPDYGWICGYGGNVIRTTDGGQTWNGTKIINIDTIDIGGNIIYDTTIAADQLESINFANENIGYTSGNDQVFKSTDGGATWRKILDSTLNFVWGVFFISADTGLAVGGGCGSNGVQQFHRTTNGGITWSKFVAFEPESGLSDAILFERDGLGYASSSGLIWRTDDGGITWYKFSKSGASDWQEELTKNGNTFLVPYSGSCYGGGKDGGWRITTDNGQTWKQFPIGVSMFGSYLLSDMKGWVCGEVENIHYTSDGGRTWELRNCGIKQNAPLDDIWFVNDTLGWVVGRGVYKFHIYDTVRPKILNDSPLFICDGDSLELYCDKDYYYYRWSNGDTTKYTKVYSQGRYTLIAYNHPCEYVYPDSIDVQIFPKTEIEILTSKTPEFCEGDSIFLWIDEVYSDLLWSTGEKTDSIVVSDSGIYSVTIIDSNGCIATQSIEIIMHALPQAEIQNIGKLVFCDGDSVSLQTTIKYFSYRWLKTSNPDSIISRNRKITIYNSGTYYVIVENEFGCIDTSALVTVNVLDLSNRLSIFSDKKPKELEFDTLGLTKMTCKYLNISNLSNEIVPLFEIYITGNIEFSIPQNQLPQFIYPGDTNRILVCFRPLDFGERLDTITIGDTCSTHLIPLVGYGKENVYTAQTDCDVDLIIKTEGTMGGEYFRFESVYPHPINNICYIDFSISSKDDNIDFSCTLKNTIGIDLTNGYVQNLKTSKSGDFFIHSGECIINTEAMSSGMYIIELNSGTYIKTIPVIICK